ncbi:unnamed protein product [Caenorhabditis sp. 36 PRJEB53466]|nr:unnamed protein product [Caenorhabditis sp. 36 PRJEB53466]
MLSPDIISPAICIIDECLNAEMFVIDGISSEIGNIVAFGTFVKNLNSEEPPEELLELRTKLERLEKHMESHFADLNCYMDNLEFYKDATKYTGDMMNLLISSIGGGDDNRMALKRKYSERPPLNSAIDFLTILTLNDQMNPMTKAENRKTLRNGKMF